MTWPKGKPRGSNAPNLIGQTFTRLTVIARAETLKEKARWVCRCVCGKETVASTSDLRRKKGTQSCGCKNQEERAANATKHGHGSRFAGRRSKTYIAWINMHRRCYYPNAKGYANYGGRGISVCEAWFDFATFLSDMGESPKDTSLERKNVNGCYEPKNCVWATKEIQDNNKRTTVYVEVEGVRMSMSQAANLLNCSSGRVRYAVQRYGTGWLEFVRAAAAIGANKEQA